ncbi:MAG: MOSC domain-containing protein YiiM [Verrucomicrobiales bacterium]|jgi:MOSC domain-containing protein YiiM
MKIHQIFVSPEHVYKGRHGQEPGTEPMREVEEVECVAGKGLVGDRYFDLEPDFKGQVTFFSQSVYDELCREFAVSDKPVSVFRRNVIVDEADLNSLIGEEFEVQGVRFSGSCEAAPCYWMNSAFAEGAHEALKGRGGLRARVVSAGAIRVDS